MEIGPFFPLKILTRAPWHRKREAEMAVHLKKGFTLIEIMIVVAIMAILALIAVGRYNAYVERSRESAVQSLLRNLVLAQTTLKTNAEATDFLPVDGVSAVDNIAKLAEYGFRPDPQVGFVGIPFDGEAPGGFLLFGAHISKGARVFVFNFVPRAGVRLFDPSAGYAVALPTAIRAYQWQGTSVTGVASLTLDPATGLVSGVTHP